MKTIKLGVYFVTVFAAVLTPIFTVFAGFSMILPLNNGSNSTSSDIMANTDEGVIFYSNIDRFNSQNLDLLTPVITNGQFGHSIGGGEIVITDDVALVPDSYLAANITEISNKNNGKISVYEVREGDTLSQIAEMFDVTVNTIRWANDFDGPIVPGQTLVILPVAGLTHVVKSGGTIADIAEIYHADVREIALFNGIDVDTQLKPGDKIIVPNVDSIEKEDDHSHAPVNYAGATQSTIASGYFKNPVPGAIITQGVHGYNGIDFGAPTGTKILAAASGKVITSKDGGWNGGYGSMIVISHSNGTQTLYSHLSKVSVSAGETVSVGDVIGYIGSTGRSTGPHLHFEVRGAKNPFSACKVGSVCSIK